MDWEYAAAGFSFDWSNHVRGSLCVVSWLSPDEFLRGEEAGSWLMDI